MLTGKHLIAGKWVGEEATFPSDPAHGPRRDFSVGTSQNVDDAVDAAEEAFTSFGWSSRKIRAALLRRIAEEIDARGADITAIGTQETGLPEARLEGERGRTTSQLRLFADHIEQDNYLDLRHDSALPDRAPLPRPDLRMIQRPIGPVAVFGASNFPLAFSVAGGDTAAALAAGCPVVVKGHPAHPGTGELVAQAIDAAIKALDIHPGVLSLVQGDKQEIGARLVQHPLIRAVGFTGSLAGGRALFDLCAQREEPIPFFGELGSVNPMFILPHASANRAEAMGAGWAASLTLGRRTVLHQPRHRSDLRQQRRNHFCISGARPHWMKRASRSCSRRGSHRLIETVLNAYLLAKALSRLQAVAATRAARPPSCSLSLPMTG